MVCIVNCSQDEAEFENRGKSSLNFQLVEMALHLDLIVTLKCMVKNIPYISEMPLVARHSLGARRIIIDVQCPSIVFSHVSGTVRCQLLPMFFSFGFFPQFLESLSTQIDWRQTSKAGAALFAWRQAPWSLVVWVRCMARNGTISP